ncbi:hypothetical protein Bbelb_160950, partial [Branchiostoma belcheri]
MAGDRIFAGRDGFAAKPSLPGRTPSAAKLPSLTTKNNAAPYKFAKEATLTPRQGKRMRIQVFEHEGDKADKDVQVADRENVCSASPGERYNTCGVFTDQRYDDGFSKISVYQIPLSPLEGRFPRTGGMPVIATSHVGARQDIAAPPGELGKLQDQVPGKTFDLLRKSCHRERHKYLAERREDREKLRRRSKCTSQLIVLLPLRDHLLEKSALSHIASLHQASGGGWKEKRSVRKRDNMPREPKPGHAAPEPEPTFGGFSGISSGKVLKVQDLKSTLAERRLRLFYDPDQAYEDDDGVECVGVLCGRVDVTVLCDGGSSRPVRQPAVQIQEAGRGRPVHHAEEPPFCPVLT